MLKLLMQLLKTKRSVKMILIFSILFNIIWQCSCFPKFEAPLRNSQKVPLYAFVDTGEIVKTILKSLEIPVQELVNKTVFEHVTKQKFSDLRQMLDKLEQRLQSEQGKIYSMEEEIRELKTPVAMTSCQTSNVEVKDGDIIQFPELITSSGINRNTLNTFQKTGMLTSTMPGLYMITASIMSYSVGACFRIQKGTTVLRNVLVSPSVLNDKDYSYHTGTGSVLVMLDVNDTVYVKAAHNMTVYGYKYSCINVFKTN